MDPNRALEDGVTIVGHMGNQGDTHLFISDAGERLEFPLPTLFPAEPQLPRFE